MKATIFGSLLIAVLAITSAAQAQIRAPYYNRPHHVNPIVGRPGEITHREAQVIRKQQIDLERTRRRAYADGYVTRAEQARIEREKAELSYVVQRSRNNGFRRY